MADIYIIGSTEQLALSNASDLGIPSDLVQCITSIPELSMIPQGAVVLDSFEMTEDITQIRYNAQKLRSTNGFFFIDGHLINEFITQLQGLIKNLGETYYSIRLAGMKEVSRIVNERMTQFTSALVRGDQYYCSSNCMGLLIIPANITARGILTLSKGHPRTAVM